MEESEIMQATYEQLVQRNSDLVDELKSLSLRTDIPWHRLSVELTLKAEERRMVMARIAAIAKNGMKK